jgi:pimeloyl-ACP methyl ester carboxylesterase
VTVALLATLLAAAPEVEHRRVTTSDGVALALYRYGPPGFAPVLLVPDLGLSRAVFDIEGEGIARHLAAAGHTVYVAELRGQGAAYVAHSAFGLAPIVSRDLPAVVAATQEPELDLVVHGYEGTLALAASVRELKGRVRRVVAVATPVLPEVPSPVASAVLKSGGDFRALPLDPEGARAFELLFTFGGRFKPGRLEALRAHAFGTLGRVTAGELLRWMVTGNLTLDDGSTVLGRLQQYDRPTLLFSGLANGFANPEFCVPLKGLATKADVRLRTFSRFELAHEDYSHLSLLQGSGARDEIFEPARRFLEEGR